MVFMAERPWTYPELSYPGIAQTLAAGQLEGQETRQLVGGDFIVVIHG